MSLKFSNEISEKVTKTLQKDSGYIPRLFYLQNQPDFLAFEAIINENYDVAIHDTIKSQLSELIKIKNPSKSFSAEEIDTHIQDHIGEKSLDEYGVWVYYPWLNKFIHILDEEEFIELRTNRNQHKITKNELQQLRTKKIGVIGLSVGMSIVSTLSMERVCGEIRIADFDSLELTNCNRLRTGLHNLGLSKVIITAREIAEIDPFIKVVCFADGINENNIDSFLSDNGKLDLLIEECDGLDIKILSRIKCKELGIPVLMETNDRCMIDIERYDLDNNYPILHGLVGNIDFHKLRNLTTEQKVPVMLRMIGLEGVSPKGKVTLLELGQSIVTWPQLASSVMMGSGVAADLARRILLNELSVSGRFYVDTQKIITNEKPNAPSYQPKIIQPLTVDDMRHLAGSAVIDWQNEESISPSIETIKKIVLDAGTAPSSGNDQPWKWFYTNGKLFLFHELSRSYSFGDYQNLASYVSLGTAIENLVLSAHHYGLELETKLFPVGDNKSCIACIKFILQTNDKSENHFDDNLYDYIYQRCTNRKIEPNDAAPPEILEELRIATESIPGAKIYFETDKKKLFEIGSIISAVDRIRLMHPQGNFDFYHREMRWSAEEAATKKYGMDISTLELPQTVLMALKVLGDDEVMKTLRDINGLQAFKNASLPNAVNSAAMALVTMPGFSPEDFVNGGRAVERHWLKATELGYAYQSLIAPLYLFPRIIFGNDDGISKTVADELRMLRKRFLEIFPGDEKRGEVFLFRIFKAKNIEARTHRYDLSDILFID